MLQATGTPPSTFAHTGGNLARAIISTTLTLALCYVVSVVSVNAVYALTLDRPEWVYGVPSARAAAAPAVAGEPRVVQTAGRGQIAQVRMAHPAGTGNGEPTLVQAGAPPH